MSVLKPGQMANATHHRCRQSQCGFFQNGGCQACDECKASSFEINNACKRCNDCENVPDALRWDDPRQKAMVEMRKLLDHEQEVDRRLKKLEELEVGR